ncbi:MAG: tRNA (adenosine(37)-N6)-threonylcarbamoyltransferase complex dimerization subunit type 1 TsaB, partial [Actinomycetota bacterium]
MTRLMLAIDTSQGTGVALLQDGKVIAERYEADTMHHAERIGTLISEVLNHVAQIGGAVATVAVGIGPAPFTGLRVGIAAAKMFAEGSRARLISVSSLDAIAFGLDLERPTLVVTDARRG